MEFNQVKRKGLQLYKNLAERGDYTDYVGQKRKERGFKETLVKTKEKVQYLSGRLPQEQQMQMENLITAEIQTSEQIKNKPVAERGYSSTYLREMSINVKKNIDIFESEWKFLLLKEFKVDLILFVFYRTQKWISDSHSQFIKNNDAHTYLESKKDEYYSVFKSFCEGSSSALVLTELICNKLKVSMTEAVINQTAIDVAGELKCNVPAFKENRLNLEKHLLKSLAQKREFQRYITYINNPRSYTETFIREEVQTQLLQTQYKEKCQSFFEVNISNLQKHIVQALHDATEKNRNISQWLQEFVRSIKDKLTFGTISSENFSDVTNLDFLKEEIEKGLNSICTDLKTLSVDELNKSRQKPDQILIDQLCDCCWETCPFCAAVCTNTVKDHKSEEEGGIDHSVPFHRSPSVNGVHYRGTVEMSLSFCTTEVAGDRSFYPDDSDRLVPYKTYRSAGSPHDTWSITPDLFKLSYWQWVVCTFKEELEKHYNLKYEGRGEIPDDWKNISYEEAIKSLEEMYK
ncbi:hypothetical protein NL108_018500 [Boleophthalmus pectinirostris]|nr:hypothetical protein NL108_018500 [Boleophthalmus pectinirostris]